MSHGGSQQLPHSVGHVVEQLAQLGIKRGGVLLVHASYRAVRPIAGGPEGLLDALLQSVGPDGTVVMPSWGDRSDTPFTPSLTPAAADLGVLAETLRRHPAAVRSEHPFAFAAIGPKAASVVAGAISFPPHAPDSPVGAVHDLDGDVLLLGVGHDANTTIHLAEIVGGAPYRVEKTVTLMEDGEARVHTYGENDHCCSNFALVESWLDEDQLIARGTVGGGAAQLCRSRDILSAVVRRVRSNPLIFLHPVTAGCEECDRARASV